VDIGLISAILIALFTGYTWVAWTHRRWYLKSSFPVIGILSLIFGILIGFRYGAQYYWEKIKILFPQQFSDSYLEQFINPYLPSYIPSFNWIFLFGAAIIYMILLHYLIPIIKRSKGNWKY
jgi:hypothetical protein